MSNTKKKVLIFYLSFLPLSFFLYQKIAVAQFDTDNYMKNIYIDMSVDYPAPNQEITLTAKSHILDLNSINITWTVDGKTTKSGIGQYILKLQSPPLGKKNIIKVSATGPGSQIYTDSIDIQSSKVDIILESDGYAPPFFKGKNPITHQNKVRIIAIPNIIDKNGAFLDPQKLVYEWKKEDGKIIREQSGYGRQSIEITGDIIPRPYVLTVTVSSPNGSQSAQGTAYVESFPPTVELYKNDKLYGPLYNKALKPTVSIGDERELGIVASPFGLNISLLRPGPVDLNWIVNSVATPELFSKPSITLRAPDNIGGVSSIRLSINNNSKILQSAEKTIQVKFEAKKDLVNTSFEN